MVRGAQAFAVLIACSICGAAQGQPIDWSAAGGHLLGTDPSPSLETPSPLRLPDLDQPFSAAVAEAAERYAIDSKLLHAVIVVESQYSPAAVSPAGAVGLMQLMPLTAAELGVQDRFDPAQNIMGGADYLARQLLRFKDVELALSAYNSGPTRVAALGRVPSIPETQQYVERVIDCYLALTAGRRVVASRECRPLEAAP